MNRNKRKRFICMALTGAMLLTVLSGCGSKKETTGEKSADSIAADQEPVSQYPIVDKPLTLKYWTPINPNATQYIQTYAENEAYQEIEKKTGIKIDFIHPAQGQEKETFNIMIASGDIPDIIDGAGNYQGGEAKGVLDGIFADLTPYIQKYAPDYYKVIKADKEAEREIVTEDGKIAAFYRVQLEPAPPHQRVILRQDWLKELGLEVPRTLDDYEKMFQLLKEKKNVDPYVLVPTGLEDQFAGPFGILPSFYLKDPKTVAYGIIQPQFKEYLALMAKWYKAGYISKDFPTLKDDQTINLLFNDKIGMYISSVDVSYNRAYTLKKEITSAPYPRLKAGDKLHNGQASWPVTGDITVVSSTSKHIVEAVRWLNYAYTEEGSRIFNYGVEGKSWVMENGQPKFTDYILNHPKYSTTNVNYILKIHFAPKLTEPDTKALPNLFKSPGALEMRNKWADDKDVDSAFRLPPIRLNDEEIKQRAAIMTDVNTYTSEMVLKFIMSAEPLDKFDQFVQEIKKMGIDEAVKITQSAYDRHMNR